MGNSEGQLLPKGQGAKCDNTAEKTMALPARPHPTLPDQGKASPRVEARVSKESRSPHKFAVTRQFRGKAEKSIL